MSGFTSPNHTQVPNDLFVMMADMGEAELKVVLCAIRKILGFHKEKPEAISYSQFEEMTGLKRPSVAKGIKAAIKRGVMRIAGKGTRGANLYELVVDEQPDQLSKETSDQLTNLTSEDTTSKNSEPVTSKKYEHTKESSKENKDIADGKVIDITKGIDGQQTKTPTRSAKQLENDKLVESLGKAYGVEAQGDDYSLYLKVAKSLVKAGIPSEEFERYVKRLRRISSEKKWTLTIPSLSTGARPSEYVASRDKYYQAQNNPAQRKSSITAAEMENRRMIMGELDESA